jgi:hypothetical protein
MGTNNGSPSFVQQIAFSKADLKREYESRELHTCDIGVCRKFIQLLNNIIAVVFKARLHARPTTLQSHGHTLLSDLYGKSVQCCYLISMVLSLSAAVSAVITLTKNPAMPPPTMRDPSIELLRLASFGGIEIDRRRRDGARYGDFRFAAVVLVEYVMIPAIPKPDGIVDIDVEFSGRVRRDVGDQNLVPLDFFFFLAG